jgi:hypothetical protein
LVLMSIACAAGNFVISVSPFVVQVKTVLWCFASTNICNGTE